MNAELFFCAIALLCSCSTVFAANTRTLCYSGSDMYQKLTVDCNAQDPTYKGQWYCAKIMVCEQYISKSRNCMTTRGCAKAEQCAATPTTIYGGEALQSSTSQLPAGMTITPSCCSNSEYFANDDGALDYDIICNSSGRGVTFSVAAVATLTAVVSLASLLMA